MWIEDVRKEAEKRGIEWEGIKAEAHGMEG